jgi:predicted Zn-dependent protease
VYSDSHREKDAINQLEALAALEPARPERQVALGLAYARAGRPDMAVMALRRVVEEHPEDQIAYVALGRVWLDIAEAHQDRVYLNKALEALDAVARRSPPDSEALLLLGRAQLLGGDTAAAERTLNQATAQFPIDTAALLKLATVAERSGHLATARDALVRYTSLSGDGTPTLERAIHIGDLSIRLNEPAVAVTWFTRAVEDAAAGPASFARLAEAQLRIGDRDGARVSIERGLQRDARNAQLLALQRRFRPAADRPGAANHQQGS